MEVPDPFDRLREIFLRAMLLAGEERRHFLDEACGADSATRREVEELLAADASPHRALQAGDGEGPGAGAARPGMPERIAGYRVLAVLGRGGMGIVYRAQQERPRREVALKVMRPEFVSAELLRRFVREVELQGALRHPGIAAVYEAGVWDAGFGEVPFFAMELVDGLPLHDYAERHALDLTARCRLIVATCTAIQHAHEHRVVHRDLKPGNVLVEGAPSAATPRVLDFGIARSSGEHADGAATMTRTGQLFGTLPYMSPEQLRGRTDEVDGRADVYSLGVMLYELLTGRLPHLVHDLPLTEVARVLTDTEPPPLRALRPDAPRDLEVVVACAIDKDVRRRYPTARAFADDLVRVLERRPVVARRATAWDRAAKFVQRNRALCVSVAAAFAALAAGLVAVSLLAASNAELAHQEAQGRLQLRETLYAAQMRAAGPWLLSPDSSPALQRLVADWPDPAPGEPELRGVEYDLARAPLRAPDALLRFPAHVDRVAWVTSKRLLVFARGALYELDPAAPAGMRRLIDEGVRVDAAIDRAGRHVVWWSGGSLWWQAIDDEAAPVAIPAAEARGFVFSGDGRWLAWTEGEQRRVVIVDRVSGERVFVGEAHAGGRTQLQFSADGRQLLTFREDPDELLLRAVPDGAVLRRLTVPQQGIRRVALAPAGDRVAAVLNDEAVGYWEPDGAARLLLHSLRFAVEDMQWNHAGSALAAVTERGEVVVMAGAQSRHFRVPAPRTATFSPDDEWLAVGSMTGELHLLRLADAGVLRVPQLRQGGGPRLRWCGDDALAIGRHDTGSRLYDLRAMGYVDETEGEWNADGSHCATRRDGRLVVVARDGSPVASCAFDGEVCWSPDPLTFAVASADRLTLRSLDGEEHAAATTGALRRMRWSHDGARLACLIGTATLEVFDRSAARLLTIEGVRGDDLAWSPDDRRLAVPTDAGLTIFAAHDGTRLRDLQGLTTVADSVDWHPGGERLVVGTAHGLLMWDVARGHVVLAIDGFRGEARWSPAGDRLALQPFGADEVWVLRALPR